MRRRLVGGLLVVAAVSASSAGAVVGAGGGGGRAEPKASVFVAPGGSDAASCRSRREACASLDRAYRAARPGEVVEIAGGRYPEQQIVSDPRKRSSRHVVFRPAKGATVTVGGLSLGTGEEADGPRHLTIRGIRTVSLSPTVQEGIGASPGTRDVVLERIDAGNFSLWGVQDVTVRGGDYGPCHVGPEVTACGNSRIDAGPLGHQTRDVVIDGARFHDYRFGPGCWQDGADCHFECMYVNGGRGITIRRSKFRDCALYDIFVTLSGQDAARSGHRRLRIENNWFDTPWDEAGPTGARRARSSALALNWCQNSPHGYRDVDIRFNSFQRNTGMLLDPNPDCRFEDIRVVGNLMAWDGCDPRWSYGFNVWSTAIRRGRCARSDRIAGGSFPYRAGASGRGFDFRLKSSFRPAADLVPATVGCPSRDVEGQRRSSRRCDAGSDELR